MPTNILCIGMAGSGKTTFVQRLNSYLHEHKEIPYLINLDPAVLQLPFGCNIDIRDSINYKKVMENFKLGPNGAIVTSLNLFSTKIDEILKIMNKRNKDFKNCLIDTPGQIECFVWSASGAIISESFASEFPTIIAYIIDTPRSSNPTTFMSNMLYACSILYKLKLPMIVVFNKTDLRKHEFAKEWMKDFEKFQESLNSNMELNDETFNGSGFMGSLINSMSLMLEEFYSTLDVVGVSSYTGEGFKEFMECVEHKVDEYNEFYLKERDRIVEEKKEKERRGKEEQLAHLMKDLGIKEGEGEVDIDEEIEKDEANGYEHGLIDVEREREYTFQEDRKGEIREGNEGIEKYEEAIERNGKIASSNIAKDISRYIKGSN